MIDFRRKENVPASLLALCSILVMLGTLVFMAIYQLSPPKSTVSREKTRRNQMKIRVMTQEAEQGLEQAQATVLANTWPGNGDDVAPAANARLTSMATRRGVKLTSFRPQRATTKTDLETLPFVITVEGPFPSVVELTRDIDSAGSRMAVSLVQVTTASDGSDRVSATVAVLAYLRPKEPTTPETPSRTALGSNNRA
ncbi:MAG: hypothetical protein ACO1SV_23275 [Fimbriimonas sp.]